MRVYKYGYIWLLGLNYKSNKYGLGNRHVYYFDKFKNIKTYINFIDSKFETLGKLEKKISIPKNN
jgi:hypothetical protein